MKEVDLEKLRLCVDYMRDINNETFKDIKWMLDGKEVLPNSKTLKEWHDEWEFTGLSNCDYGKHLLGI